MSMTQPATAASTPPATSTEAPTGNSTSAIADNYDNKGHQVVDDGVFDFDQPQEVKEDRPLVTTILDEDPEENPEGEPATETSEENETPNENEPPAQTPAKVESPKNESGLSLYANKFKNVQELKNSFIELGGDPAQFADNVQLLEQAYQVRQREFSRTRAEMAASQPKAPPKTIEQMMQEEFGAIDPATFQSPLDMWNAMMKGFQNVLTNQQSQQSKQPTITPMEMMKQTTIHSELSTLEGEVPRLKTDTALRMAFSTHIRMMRDEGRMPVKVVNGVEIEDLKLAFKDLVQGQAALVNELQRTNQATAAAKNVSTAASPDNGGTSLPKSKSPEDKIVDDLLGYKADFDRKYN